MSFRALSVLIFLFFGLWGNAQVPELNATAEISLLTCGPGDVLYSKFGHNAIRVQDLSQGIDVVYNYGTFDFRQPNFYMKFARGKLNYSLSRAPFRYFIAEYRHEQRWVAGQTLNLSISEKNRLFELLETNYLPENREYLYDPIFDNCATRIWELLEKGLGKQLTFDANFVEGGKTLRELVNDHLPTNDWGALGINLAWGAVVDREATPKEYLFLPDYLMAQTSVATYGDKPLSKEKTLLAPHAPIPNKRNFLLSPLFWLTLLLLSAVWISYQNVKGKKTSKWLDVFLFSLTGLSGLLISFLWFATDHGATKQNLNILWAMPFNSVIAFLLLKKNPPSWLKKYYIFLLVLMGALGLVWVLGVQMFPPALVPLLIALALRYLFLIRGFRGSSGTVTSG